MPDARILIADDQQDVLAALRLLLKPEGFAIESASSPAGILAALEGGEFEVALIDLNYTRDTTSGEEGLDLLQRMRALDTTLPIVVMTAWGSIELAVEAMRRGARDFVQKPWENQRLLSILTTQVELSRALKRGQRLEAENRMLKADGAPAMIAQAQSMQPVLEVIRKVGPSDANIMITGENGVGKGLVAQRLHAVSPRARQVTGDSEHGRLERGAFRERAVRPREGRVHRRQVRSCRPVRAGRRRQPVPGRDRQRAAQPAGEAPAGDRERASSSASGRPVRGG